MIQVVFFALMLITNTVIAMSSNDQGTVEFYNDITTNCYYYRFDNGFCERYIIACPTQVIRQENCDEDCNCETFILKKPQ